MDANWEAMLEKPVDDVREPDIAPIGTYILRVDKWAPHTAQTGTNGIKFTFGIEKALEDVDPEELKLIEDLKKIKIHDTFWVTEDSHFMLVKFLRDDLGMKTNGRTTTQLLSEVKGFRVQALVGQEPNKRGDRMYNVITSYEPAE